MGDNILIVDAMNLFTRHYVAHPAMNSNGEQVGGVVGFLYELCRHLEEEKPSKLIVVWESGGSQKRRNILKEYKSGIKPGKLNRFYDDIPDTTMNRNFQVATLIQTIELTNIVQLYIPDTEADDVIAYLSKYYFRDVEQTILSSDKDFYQLISETTKIYSPTWKKHVGIEEVIEKFNIHPNNFALAKAIVGDKSDNIDGVKGVGFKFLAKYMTEFASDNDVYLDDVLDKCTEAINNGSKITKYCKIISGKDIIKRNIKLINLDIGCLTSQQIQKTQFAFENIENNASKIETIRKLLGSGITNFNVDRFFFAMGCLKV